MWFDLLLFAIGIPVGAVAGLILQRLVDVADHHEMWCDVQVTGIQSEASSQLKGRLGFTTEDGKVVNEPYIADFYLWSTGKRDIPKSGFDDGKDLVIDLGVPIVTTLDTEDLRQMESVDLRTDPRGKISVQPSLIRKRQLLHRRYVVDGYPSRSITNPITDLEDVRSYYKDWRSNPPAKVVQRVVGLILAVLGFLTFAGIPIFGAAYYANTGTPFAWNDELGIAATIIAVIGLVVGIFMALTSTDASRKANRALRILNSGTERPMVESALLVQRVNRAGV